MRRHVQHRQHDQTQRAAFSSGNFIPGVFYGGLSAEECLDGGG